MTDYDYLYAFGALCIVVWLAYRHRDRKWAQWILNLIGKEKK